MPLASLAKRWPPTTLCCRNNAYSFGLLSRICLRSPHALVVSLFHERSSSWRFVLSMLLTKAPRVSSVKAQRDKFSTVNESAPSTSLAKLSIYCNEQLFLCSDSFLRVFSFPMDAISCNAAPSPMPSELSSRWLSLQLSSSSSYLSG